MSRILRYFLFSFGLITLGLLAGFKVENVFSIHGKVEIDQSLRKLEQALVFIEKNYVKEPNHEALVDNAIKGIMEGLDPHSFYISANEMQQMDEQMTGSFEGVGIEYNVLDDTIYVVTPISGGPSEKAGVLAGDRILKVDGINVAGIRIKGTDVTKFLKGEKGSKVKLTVKRLGINRLLEFTVQRDKIPIFSLDYSYMVNKETGFIKVSRFSETTYDEFSEALRKLKGLGMKNLILDMRGNPGGYLTMAQKMADEFLSGGKLIVTTDGRIPESRQRYVASNQINGFEQGGLVVLVDYGSASAAEIVAGAVQDHDRGLILGVRSYGKGLVQVQKKFEDGSAMRIVISEYFTPSGRCIQKPYNKTHEEYDNEIEERFASGEIYDASKIKFPDSLKFYTDAGRIVYGGGGIFPDVFIADDTTLNSKYLTELVAADMFRRFAYDYVDHNHKLVNEYPGAANFSYHFEIDSEMMKKFTSFASQKGINFEEKGYTKSMGLIKNRIKAYIGKRLYQDDGFYPNLYEDDVVVQKALNLMPSSIELQKTGKFASLK
ncbi:MAG: S41 family peptidase [Bacteroidia bacterium]